MNTFIHYNNCPICGSSDISFALKSKDYTVSKNYYEIWECTSCNGRFTQDVPTSETMGAYYKSDQYVSHSDTYKGLINKIYHIVRKRTLKQKLALLQKFSVLQKGNLLDIGSGVGAFAAEAKQNGWAVTALEPNEDARSIAKEKFNIESFPSHEIFNLPPESYDGITLWHVLEHVHELQSYVDTFFKLLKKDGVLLIAVPNFTSFDAQKYESYWAAYDVPRHIYHFSPKTMQVLMQKHHLTVIKMLPMKYDSFYVSMLSERYKNGKNNYIRAFINGFVSNYKAHKNAAQYSSIIYVIKKEIS